MSANFFKINKGITLEPQSGADPAGRDGDIYYNETVAKFRKFQNGAWSDLDTSGGGGSSNTGWVAEQKNIGSGVDFLSVIFPTPQNDTSYIVLAMMFNDTDPTPQYQQVVITAKSTNGFTAKWNAVTDSANYKLLYIVPLKAFMLKEEDIPATSTSFTATYHMPMPSATYGVLPIIKNTVDATPQFQPMVVTARTTSGFSAKWNVATDTANYVLSYLVNATGLESVSNGATSKTLTLPVAYGSANYSVYAFMYNETDATPQFQPLIITAKTSTTFTVSWSDPTDSSNYSITYYAISYTT